MHLSGFLLFTPSLFGQTKIISGKVIDQNLNPIYEASIWNADTLTLSKSNLNGIFKIEIPLEVKTLRIGAVSMEPQLIELNKDCNIIEVILLPTANYDFISVGRMDRLRKKDFDKLSLFHKSAFEEGIFQIEEPCYTSKFLSFKKKLKKIHKTGK